MGKDSKISVFRYDPSVDSEARYEKYKVPYQDGMTVLEALKFIYDNYTPLGFRYSCRIKTCGTCAVVVNNKPVLACKEKASAVMKIAPLPYVSVIRDLVVDFDEYNARRTRIRAFIEKYTEDSKSPRNLSYNVVKKYRECDICTRCLICDNFCPIFNENKNAFAGPSILLEIAKFKREPQDNGNRLGIALSEGILKCDLCGKCTEVCPAEIPVHEIIGELKESAIDYKSRS